jgi:hypothetical protein
MPLTANSNDELWSILPIVSEAFKPSDSAGALTSFWQPVNTIKNMGTASSSVDILFIKTVLV